MCRITAEIPLKIAEGKGIVITEETSATERQRIMMAKNIQMYYIDMDIVSFACF